jgi:hypothetical protein
VLPIRPAAGGVGYLGSCGLTSNQTAQGRSQASALGRSDSLSHDHFVDPVA